MQEAKFGKIEGRQIKCPAIAITPLSQQLIELDQKKKKRSSDHHLHLLGGTDSAAAFAKKLSQKHHRSLFSPQ